MSDAEDEEEPATVFLNAPLIRGTSPAAPLTSTGKLVCTSPSFLEDSDEYEFWLTSSEETLGRSDQCSVQIKSSDLSRTHAKVTAFSNQWVIEDCGSRNGIWINDVRVASRSKISSGDSIRLGRVPFRFEVIDLAPSELVEAVKPPPKKKPSVHDVDYDDTIPLELSDDGELVEVRLDLEPEPVGLQSYAYEDDERRSKAMAHASVVGVQSSVDEALTIEAAMEQMREALPGIIQKLIARAQAGDVDAVRACLDYAGDEVSRLPEELELTDSLKDNVNRTLAAMTSRSITPRQAFEILQTFETARSLFGKRSSNGQ